MTKRLFAVIGMVLLSAQAFASQAPSGQIPTGQAEFLPVDQLSPSEQLPAAPLLISAYAFVWIAVFFYVWTVWHRLNTVEAEMRVLEKRQSHRGEGAAPGLKTDRTHPR